MSLEKKDVRAKVSAESHAQLSHLADFHEKDISELASLYLEKMIAAESHALKLYTERVTRLGKAGNASGEPAASPGKSGKRDLKSV